MPSKESTTRTLGSNLWMMAAEMYQGRWTHQNGKTPSKVWLALLSKIGPDGCRKLVSRCRDEIRLGNKWPPTVAEAEAMLLTRSQAEYESAYARWMAKQPEGRPEQWVFANASWNLKRTAAGRELSEFIKYLKQADELERSGQLELPQDELLALPVHSSVSLTDKKHQEFAQSGKAHRFTDRIKRITQG